MERLLASVTDLRHLLHMQRQGQQWSEAILPVLDTPACQDAYVCGIELGKHVLGILQYYTSLGFSVEQEVVLAGMIDTFHQRVRLTSMELKG